MEQVIGIIADRFYREREDNFKDVPLAVACI